MDDTAPTTDDGAPPNPWRRTLGLLAPHRPALALLFVLVILEAISSIASPLFLRAIVDHALPRQDTTLLSVLALGMIAAAVVRSGLDVKATRVSTALGQGIVHDLRCRLFAHVQRMSLAFFTRTRSGEVQTRIAGDVGAIDNVVTNAAGSIVQNVTTVAAVLVALFVLSWPLALFSCATVPALAWLNRRTGRSQRRIGRDRQRRSGDLASLVNESLSVSGVVLARTTDRGDELLHRFREESRAISDLEIEAGASGRWRRGTVVIAFSAMPAAIYWLGGITAAHDIHLVSIGTLVAFTSMQNRLVSPVSQLLTTWQSLQGAGGVFARIFEVLDTPIDISEKDDARELPTRPGHLVFEDVWFRHEADGPWTLQSIDLDVPEGSSVALVGATGAGKTTLALLGARLYEAERGRVLIDGVDVRDLSFAALAGAVGVVSQDAFLLHASVRENLRFARPDATDDELVAAARAAGILDVIEALPDGWDTVAGERGTRFSGGERQRLSIARTLLRDPPILVLDEATSALDATTERIVQDAVDGLAAGRTTLTIAHRLSTIREADRIVVLDAGRIVEQGTHDELATQDGAYAGLLRAADRGAVA